MKAATVHGREVGEQSVVLDNCSIVFQSKRGPFRAIDSVSLSIRRGDFVSIVGPSGSGKSTILSLISGLLRPTEGTVEVLGRQVKGINTDVGFIFQRDALLPWKTALENVMLPLRFRGRNKSQARAQAKDWLARVGLGRFGDSYPHQLSGGMRKRVSIAATLCYEPRVLLMDEPFSALDAQTRARMETDLLGLWQSSADQTVVFVTHDLEEAVAMSDRVVLLSSSPGRVIADDGVGLARPRDLHEVKFDPSFVELHRKIWDHLRGEVLSEQQREAQESTW